MKLADLRRLAIRRQIRIRFPLRNGLECTVTEHGVAQVAGLKGVPDFNLEEELAAAPRFELDQANASPKVISRGSKRPVEGSSVGREELAAMAAGGVSAEAPAHEDD